MNLRKTLNFKRSFYALMVLSISLLAFTLASCSHSDDSTQPERITDTLRIGLISPTSGDLGHYGQAPINAATFAIQDINAAGGNVELTNADSGTDIDVGLNSVRQLLDDGVHAIVGAYSSKVSLGIIDTVIAENIVMVSPASSSTKFTDYDDNDLFFRTAASSEIWAKVTAQEIDSNGDRSVGIIYRDDAFGTDFAAETRKELERLNISVGAYISYSSTNPDLSKIVSLVSDRNFDSLVIAAFDEFIPTLGELVNAGVKPPNTEIYLIALGQKGLGLRVDPTKPGLIEGIIDVNPAPHPTANPTLDSRVIENNTYNTSTYDAVIILALASLIANSIDPVVFAQEINGVTRDGETCKTYAKCAELIENGENIDYDGASGPLEFADAGEPISSSYRIARYDSAGEPTTGRIITKP